MHTDREGIFQILAADSALPFFLHLSKMGAVQCCKVCGGSNQVAEKLGVPVHFDLDLGEVFDEESMGHGCKGKAQHREPAVLKGKLKEEFPNVEYVCDDHENIIIEGNQQHWPEPFAGARMRFCYKTKKLVQKSAAEMMSMVIVTHGDGVAAVVGLLRETWSIRNVPYTAYAVCSRKVKVMEEHGNKVLEQPVYADPGQWELTLGKGLTYNEVKAARKIKQMHKEHEQEMKEMNQMSSKIQTEYDLEYHHHEHFKAALGRLGASQKDVDHLLDKSKSSHHHQVKEEHVHRIKCKPPN